MAAGFTSYDMDLDTSFTFSNNTGYLIQGAQTGDTLGTCVSGAGDINNDTYADVIIGAYQANRDNIFDRGVVYVIFGKRSGFETVDLLSFISGDSTGYMILGAMARDGLGRSVSGAGDVNNDGFDDVLISAYRKTLNGREGSGAVYVIFGMAGTYLFKPTYYILKYLLNPLIIY
jgi:hypothetical protein